MEMAKIQKVMQRTDEILHFLGTENLELPEKAENKFGLSEDVDDRYKQVQMCNRFYPVPSVVINYYIVINYDLN